MSHVLYLAREAFLNSGNLTIDSLSAPFWADVLQKRGDLTGTTLQGKDLTDALTRLRQVGDAFITVGRRYAPDGRMSEQINR